MTTGVYSINFRAVKRDSSTRTMLNLAAAYTKSLSIMDPYAHHTFSQCLISSYKKLNTQQATATLRALKAFPRAQELLKK